MQKEITKCKSIKNYVKTLCNYLTLDDELTLPALISLLVTIAQTQYTELIKIQLELCLAHSIGDIRDRLILYLSQLNVSNTSHINTEELQDYLKINKEELINLNELLAIDFKSIKNIISDYKEVHRERTKMDEIVEMLGKALLVTPKVYLTEGGDYEVSVIKHIHDEYIVLQYDILNLLSNQYIADVRVSVAEVAVIKVIPSNKISFNEMDTCYVVIKYDKLVIPFPILTLKTKLEFKVTEISSGQIEEGTYDDELILQNTILIANCYIKPLEINKDRFVYAYS